MNTIVIGAIRTITPMVVGWLVAVLALPDSVSEQLEGAIFVVASGLYYVIARWIEERYSWAGWLLGFNAEPQYAQVETVYDIADETSFDDDFEDDIDFDDEDHQTY